MCCRQLRQAGAKAEAPAAAPGVDLQAALPPPKKKWKFLQACGLCGGFGRRCNCLKRCACLLQKYWHKGAFFQGEDEDGEAVLGDIMRRDYDAPTGEDKFDRQMLPKVMQVGVVQHGVSFWAGAGISHPNKLHPSSTWWSSNLLCSTPRSCHRSITCARSLALFFPCCARSATLGGAAAQSGRTCWQRTRACKQRILQTLLPAVCQGNGSLKTCLTSHAPRALSMRHNAHSTIAWCICAFRSCPTCPAAAGHWVCNIGSGLLVEPFPLSNCKAHACYTVRVHSRRNQPLHLGLLLGLADVLLLLQQGGAHDVRKHPGKTARACPACNCTRLSAMATSLRRPQSSPWARAR